MTISIIVPIGDETAWRMCEASLRASIDAYAGETQAEIVTCYDLEHKGVWVARNEGLRRATGEWIAWVDCDDAVEKSWFSTICREIERGGFDVLVFGIIQERDGVSKTIYSPAVRELDGESYARWMLGGKGMPHWLWHRVFRRELWKGVTFIGRVKEDYQGSLQVLPRVKHVRFIPDILYRYIRHGHGLSAYVQKVDYGNACDGFLKLIERLPFAWQAEARMGMGLMLTDVILHDPRACGANRYLRPYFWKILFSGGMSFCFRMKALLASLMFWR